MAVEKNMNEQKTEKKEKGKWEITVFIDSLKEAIMIADAEHFPRPSEQFNNYPVAQPLPSLYTFFQMLRRIKRFSSMGIYSRVRKLY